MGNISAVATLRAAAEPTQGPTSVGVFCLCNPGSLMGACPAFQQSWDPDGACSALTNPRTL